MSQGSNVCPICSGVVQVAYTITFEQCKPTTMRVNPPEIERFCMGHQKPDYDAYMAVACDVVDELMAYTGYNYAGPFWGDDVAISRLATAIKRAVEHMQAGFECSHDEPCKPTRSTAKGTEE